MAESTQIRIDLDTKQKLEVYRDFKRVKSHSDAIFAMMNEITELNKEVQRLKYDNEMKQNESDREAVFVGEKFKSDLKDISDEFGFYSEVKVIDLLLHHFNITQNFDRSTMMYACDLKAYKVNNV